MNQMMTMSLWLGMISVYLYGRCRSCFFSPTRDSPKKARAKEPSTPSNISKTAPIRQLIFDTAV